MALRKDGKESKADKRKKRQKAPRERPNIADLDLQICTSNKNDGSPCRGNAIKGPNPDNEYKFCFMHHPDITDAEKRKVASMGGKANASRYPKPHELLRRVIEARPDAFIKPHLEALGLEIELKDSVDPERPGQVDIEVHEVGDGAVLYGVSKDGDVVISTHKDLEAQQRAAERLFDRVYGKPKVTELNSTGDADEAPEIIPYDEQRQAEVVEILSSTGVQAGPPPPGEQVGNGNGNGSH